MIVDIRSFGLAIEEKDSDDNDDRKISRRPHTVIPPALNMRPGVADDVPPVAEDDDYVSLHGWLSDDDDAYVKWMRHPAAKYRKQSSIAVVSNKVRYTR